MRRFLSTVIVALSILVFSGPGIAADVLDPHLEGILNFVPSHEEIPVIISFSDKADLTPLAGKSRRVRRSAIVRALREKAEIPHRDFKAFLERKGVRRAISLWIMNGMAVTARTDTIRELAGLPGIESIRLDSAIQVPVQAVTSQTIPEWNLSALHVPELWSLGVTGSSIVVANMDTGVDIYHPDLQSKWRGGSNSWFDPNGQHLGPHDVNGHGTQTIGIMVGGDAGGTSLGVAPDSQWIAVKIFNDAGYASYSAIHQGFQWLLDPDGDPDTNDAPDVVNNSWGLDNLNACSTEFQADIEALRGAGIAVSFSAGNSGPYSPTSASPANNPGAFPIGAVDQSLTIAYFSSRGPSACDGGIYPEVVAPGVNIRTTDLTFGGVFPNSYATVSGSSFASPHISGTMALLLSAFPELPLSDLETALKVSAMDFGAIGPDNDYGYGLIDALAAYDYINSLTGTPLSAVDDAYSIAEDSVLAIGEPGVLANDSGRDGYLLTAVLVSSVSNGTLTFQPNGAFLYVPNFNFYGPDSFTYKVRDSLYESEVVTVSINVAAVNDPPVAVDDRAITLRRRNAVTINVAANDFDIDGSVGPATLKIVSRPRKGSVVNNRDGTVTYRVMKEFLMMRRLPGTDSFTYTVNDKDGATSNVATVRVRIM